MTSKDYEVLAKAIRASRQDASQFPSVQALAQAIVEIADVLEADNPRFDRNKFIDACKGYQK